MKVILLSGGSGKRLWPMSNDSRSKQFLRVLQGEHELISMLQRVWTQLGDVGLQREAYVCASKAQQDAIIAQLGDVPCIEEPARRDTFPAISLAALYLHDVARVHPDEVVVVMPVDHYVDSDYFLKASNLENILNESDANIALMGVTPTEPTSKFGYIRVGDRGALDGAWCAVESFVEKPHIELARELMRDKALWNCGVFAFRLGYLKTLLQDRGYPADYSSAVEGFELFAQRSFDYEVLEHEENIVVTAYHGEWTDLGTWDTLSNQMSRDFVGPGASYDCQSTHVINELGIPLVTMGLKNTVVVSTPDGILVADKAASARLKDAASHFEGRPMYEERRWGSYRVLDYQKLTDGTEVLTKCIILNANSNISYQKHFKRSEVWTILEGSGQLALDEKLIDVAPGDVIQIHPQQWHAIRADSRLMFIEVQRGSELIEEDIVRKFMTWSEVEQHCLPAPRNSVLPFL